MARIPVDVLTLKDEPVPHIGSRSPPKTVRKIAKDETLLVFTDGEKEFGVATDVR